MWTDPLVALINGGLGQFLLVYSLVVVGHYLILGGLAFAEVVRQKRQRQVLDADTLFEGDLAPTVSIAVPAYNEELTIVEAVHSLMQLRYPSFEIIVVNDGSTDDTLGVLTRTFGLRPSKRTLGQRVPRERVRGVYASPQYPNLVVLDVINGGGKARANNMALAYARQSLFFVIDADSLLEPDTLLQLAIPFAHDSDTVLVGGLVLALNGCEVRHGRVVEHRLAKNGWALFQTVEYLRAMLVGRLGWQRLDSLFIVSGALGLFSRAAVVALGGYRTTTMGEDMELTMRLQRFARQKRRSSAAGFVSNTGCWTEVPEIGKVLAGQRRRWHQGLTECLWLNFRLLTGPNTSPGLQLAYLVYVFVELLGPVFEAIGYLAFLVLLIAGRIDVPFVALYFAVLVLGGTMISMTAVAMDLIACPRFERTRDVARLLLIALVENLGYRQITVGWRLRGLVGAILRHRGWGPMIRRGSGSASGGAPSPPSATAEPPAAQRAA